MSLQLVNTLHCTWTQGGDHHDLIAAECNLVACLVKGTAPKKIVPDKTLSDKGGAPEHQSLKPRTAELCAIPVWWESMHKWEK